MVVEGSIQNLLAAAQARLERVGPREAYDAVAHDDALLVDIRSEVQRQRDGVIPGARFYPRNVLEWRLDPASGHSDPEVGDARSRRVILVCHEGYASSLAAATLQDLGFARATDLVGGFCAWRDAGLPVRPLAAAAAAP